MAGAKKGNIFRHCLVDLRRIGTSSYGIKLFWKLPHKNHFRSSVNYGKNGLRASQQGMKCRGGKAVPVRAIGCGCVLGCFSIWRKALVVPFSAFPRCFVATAWLSISGQSRRHFRLFSLVLAAASRQLCPLGQASKHWLSQLSGQQWRWEGSPYCIWLNLRVYCWVRPKIELVNLYPIGWEIPQWKIA